MSTREVVQACRCQLLTGSYEGASRSCPCRTGEDCHLTKSQRRRLADHPKVHAALERNKLEYEGAKEQQHKGVGV